MGGAGGGGQTTGFKLSPNFSQLDGLRERRVTEPPCSMHRWGVAQSGSHPNVMFPRWSCGILEVAVSDSERARTERRVVIDINFFLANFGSLSVQRRKQRTVEDRVPVCVAARVRLGNNPPCPRRAYHAKLASPRSDAVSFSAFNSTAAHSAFPYARHPHAPSTAETSTA